MVARDLWRWDFVVVDNKPVLNEEVALVLRRSEEKRTQLGMKFLRLAALAKLITVVPPTGRTILVC